MTLFKGDSLEILKALPENSIDSIVTDPPYGLGQEPDALSMLKDWITDGHHDVRGKGFMGKTWDAFVPQPNLWKECLRVLKPRGHLLSFAGTRTQDLVTLGLRIAGFEIRDCVAWVYGSGFPKSLDVSKAIEKSAGSEREITGPTTEQAKQWQGWGTALKPAYEPIIVARKPLIGTVAQNVLQHGTGAINIDACRIETDDCLNGGAYAVNGQERHDGTENWRFKRTGVSGEFHQASGRWPANFIHDGSPEVLELFPDRKGGTSNGDAEIGEESNNIPLRRGKLIPRNDSGSAARFFYCAKASASERDQGLESFEAKDTILTTGKGLANTLARCPIHDAPFPSGSQVYSCGCQQAYDTNQGERRKTRKNIHPTVKPIALMRYLCRLVTPPNGTVLDPFMGSGTTGIACKLEGFNFMGIEREEEYFSIAEARIAK